MPKLSPAQRDELQALVDGKKGCVIKESVVAVLLKRGYVKATHDPKDILCVFLGADQITITKAGRAALAACNRRHKCS